jgi:hypothetical protein
MFDKNTAKPYWAGHARADIVETRKEFVQKFLTNKDRYYLISEGDDPQWNIPKNTPTIVICMYLTSNSLSSSRLFFSSPFSP